MVAGLIRRYHISLLRKNTILIYCTRYDILVALTKKKNMIFWYVTSHGGRVSEGISSTFLQNTGKFESV
jgi:hypothetical protein